MWYTFTAPKWRQSKNTIVLPGRNIGIIWCVSGFQQGKEHGLHCPHVSHDGEERCILHRDGGLLYDVEIG